MRCTCVHDILRGGRGRTALDDDGSLAITAWSCRNCAGVTEQVFMLPRRGQTHGYRSRFIRFPSPM